MGNRYHSVSMKIAVEITVLIFAVMCLMGSFMYFYFKNMIIRETMNLCQKNMEKQSARLDSAVDQLYVLGQIIILDEAVQEFCLQNREDESYAVIEGITQRLSQLSLPQENLATCMIQTDNGFFSSKYQGDRIFEHEVTQGMEHMEGSFGRMYSIPTPVGGDVFNYRLDIRSTAPPYHNLGTLLLVVKADNIRSLLQMDDFSSFALLNKDSPAYAGVWDERLSDCLADQDIRHEVMSGEKGAVKTKDGYFLWQKQSSSNFCLYGFLTYRDMLPNLWELALFFLLVTILTIAVVMWLLLSFVLEMIRPIALLAKGMEDFSNGNMDIQMEIHTHDELEQLGNRFNSMVKSIDSYVKQKIEDEKIKKKIHFDLLISKIHPHFLYNTLNSIRFKALEDENRDIEDMVRSLVTLLQDNMMVYGNVITDSFGKELNVIEAYCRIQKYKYKDKFTIVYEIAPDTMEIIIPKNILQPVIENSIFHGIAGGDRAGTVTVSSRLDGEMLKICIQDDGVGISEEALLKIRGGLVEASGRGTLHSIGITSIMERLDSMYQSNYRFEMTGSPGCGMSTTISLPITGLNMDWIKEMSDAEH